MIALHALCMHKRKYQRMSTCVITSPLTPHNETAQCIVFGKASKYHWCSCHHQHWRQSTYEQFHYPSMASSTAAGIADTYIFDIFVSTWCTLNLHNFTVYFHLRHFKLKFSLQITYTITHLQPIWCVNCQNRWMYRTKFFDYCSDCAAKLISTKFLSKLMTNWLAQCSRIGIGFHSLWHACTANVMYIYREIYTLICRLPKNQKKKILSVFTRKFWDSFFFPLQQVTCSFLTAVHTSQFIGKVCFTTLSFFLLLLAFWE